MSQQIPKLILIPGLGADERLFEMQRQSFPDVWVPPWIMPQSHESLSDYAARMAEIIAARFSRKSRLIMESPDPTRQMGLSTSDRQFSEPLVLGGVSLGGMLAYELARHLKSQAVILIASCRTHQGIRGFFRATGHLWPAVPVGAFKIAKFLTLPALRMFGKLTPAQQQLCADMFSEMDPRFMHWAISAILRWKPTPIRQIHLYQIHGARDQIIPAKYVSPDEIIPDGGHLINLTHSDAVNAFIRNVIAKVQSS